MEARARLVRSATIGGMNRAARVLIFLLAGTIGGAPRAAAQNGSIEFVARATPTGGLEEPVRGFPFFLLSKSFEAIEKDADAASPKPDMNAFIAKLEVSPELKAWMKKNAWVSFSGEDFTHKLHTDDVMGVPEFYTAYMERTAGDQTANFPKPKYKLEDKVKDPAKYEKLKAEYQEAIRHYIDVNPRSVDGLDISLADIDPGPAWRSLTGKRSPEIHRRTVDLAQSKYLVGRTETNLQGQGFLRDIPPGTYWLSTLDVSADVGDQRAQWDLEVTVRPGETEEVALSNANSVRSSPVSP
jgi:hypothetical protein